MKFLIPVIKQRMADMERNRSSGASRQEPVWQLLWRFHVSQAYVLQNDCITWLLHAFQSRPDPRDRSPERIAAKIIAIHFAGVHTTTLTMSGLFINLFGSSKVSEFVTAMREEIDRIVRKTNGIWTKAALSKTIRLDSAYRESMRVSGLTGTGLARTVMATKGIRLENGYHLPRGMHLAIAVYSIHHDENIYPHADDYDPFRFSRPLEKTEKSNQDSGNEVAPEAAASSISDRSTAKVESMVSFSETFLAFGHGPHAW